MALLYIVCESKATCWAAQSTDRQIVEIAQHPSIKSQLVAHSAESQRTCLPTGVTQMEVDGSHANILTQTYDYMQSAVPLAWQCACVIRVIYLDM